MKAIAETMRLNRPLTPLEQEAVNEVVEAARSFADLPAERQQAFAFDTKGYLSGKQMTFAVLATLGTPEQPIVKALVEARNQFDPREPEANRRWDTKHGTFWRDDVTAFEAVISRRPDAPFDVIKWPVSWTNGQWIFQREADAPRFQEPPTEPYQREWWEGGDAA